MGVSRNLMWFVVGGLALGAAFLLQSPYMAISVYAFLLLVAVSHVSSVAWLAGLDCERTVSTDILQQGEEVAVEVTVTNRRGFPIPWIFIEDRFPPGAVCRGENARLAVLMPGRSVQLSYRLVCPYRGYHRIGPLVMESGDLFGLQKRFRTGRQQEYVSVLPTVAYIDTFNIAARRPHGPVRIANRAYEDPTRIAGVREYVVGDPMNRIHWKASARTGELYTKTLEAANVLGATLVLDLHRDNYKPEKAAERMELAITTTASIAWLLQMSGEQVGLLTNALDAAEVARYEVESRQALSREEIEARILGEESSDRICPLEVPTRRSPIQARTIAENLARVLPGGGLDVADLILDGYRKLPRDAALLPVVPQVTESLALVLAELKLTGFPATVFFIADPRGYEEAVRLLAPHQIHVFHIEHARDLHEISPARIGT